MTLPFDTITKTGVLLPLFHETCEKGFKNGDDPTTIVDTFFKKYQARRSKESQINLLFRFIQYIERQVVLFDAIEDAAFPIVNNMNLKCALCLPLTLHNSIQDLCSGSLPIYQRLSKKITLST